MKTHFETIIIGGGFGGLSSAIKLGKKKKDVLVIDRVNHHLFQPLLYQVATAALAPNDIATPIREVLYKYPCVSVIMDTVQSINSKTNTVFTDRYKLTFDHLIVATGARHSYFGKDEWEKFAPGLKSIEDAVTIRENILRSFELSEMEEDENLIQALTTFVVVGAGPTGVETAGAIAEIALQTLAKNFSHIDTRNSKIYLVEGGDRVLAAFHPTLSQKALKSLEDLGVQVKLNSRVQNITNDGVYIGEEFIPSKNIIWAAGNSATQILKTLDTPLDRMGRVIVEKDCSIKNNANIFVIGDAACFYNEDNETLPSLAPVAVQQGKFVSDIIIKNLPRGKRNQFEYFDKGIMATIGKKKAVLEVGKIRISGLIAWLAWSFVHLLFLVFYRSRIFVFFTWVFNYISGQRGSRLIK